jgi:RecA-family ATPase
MEDTLTPEQLLRADGARFCHYSPKPAQHGRVKVLSVQDVMNAPPREYLLEGLLAPRECSVWWGGPKSGKTFLLLRLTYGLSQGRGMWGREASKVAVCYVAAEGASGLRGRIHALHDAMGPTPDFHLVAQVIDLFDVEADLSDLIAVLNDRKCGLVVLDTLARVMGSGDENQTRE